MAAERPSASPLVPVLGFTGLSSFAAGTATLSIFFVTEKPPYSFTAVQQYALALVVGVTYTLGALGAGRVRRACSSRGVPARAFLALLSLALAALACLPLALRTDAAVFVLLGVYAPLTGLFWPLVEGYVSGGRRGAELRSAMGRFNVTWSVTLLPSFLCIPPLLRQSAGAVFAAVALTHLVSLAFLFALGREPGAHEDEAHAVPPRYGELLRVHRVLHAMSYLVMYALSPFLPALLARLGLEGGAASLFAALWLAARVLGFLLLERWHGWHGRWSVAVVGALLVLGGFGAVLLAPGLGAHALIVVAAALCLFGFGLAALYTAALYYAFEVGGSDGGAAHEALVGLGYSIGPSCGLAVCALERAGTIQAEQRDGVLLAGITVLCCLGALYAWRHRRAPSAAA
ncbi:MAG: hypothetical protein EXS08_00295 [Planctomycetes bacterium]|nr:hypothetical protein [Planctomycetota bacterium]